MLSCEITLYRYRCDHDFCERDINYHKISEAKAIYQNKVSKVYLYFANDEKILRLTKNKFVGWVSGQYQNNEPSTVFKMPTE